MRFIVIKFILLVPFYLLFLACRGRDFAKPMPALKVAPVESLIVFRSADEHRANFPRIHFVDPSNGAGTELDRSTPTALGAVLAEPHLVYGSLAITNHGKFAQLLPVAEAQAGKVYSYAVSQLSPDGRYFLRRQPGKLTIARSDGGSSVNVTDDLADCAWRSNDAMVCLAGKYQETRAIVEVDLRGQKKATLYAEAGKPKLENLQVSRDGRLAAFSRNLADTVSILLLDLNDRRVRTIAEFQQRYIFALALAPDGTVAARIVNSTHTPGKLDPYDVWISAPFGGRSSPGYLLNLPALEAPGFFSGKGFTGVDSFAFSPDGQALAILRSGEDDCRMADEGGNLACRKDIYIVARNQPGVRRLTQFQIQSAEQVRWLKFEK